MPQSIRTPHFPDVNPDLCTQVQSLPSSKVDVLLVNPPSPDGGVWIRTQHRVGRRSREEMIWPQCSLAQLAAMLYPDYSVAIVDAIAERMSWHRFEEFLRGKAPKYYLTHVTAPTLTNDMYGVMIAKSIGANTIAFGTHVTPMHAETMQGYPALDYILRGEPELTLRELIDSLERRLDAQPAWVKSLLQKTDPSRQSVSMRPNDSPELSTVKGLVWRNAGRIQINSDRPFIPDLDDLPMPLHNLLPLKRYRMPLIKGSFTFVLTSRGCPARCSFCIKHVSYQNSVRLLSPVKIMDELLYLYDLGVHNFHMYADLFTVSKPQVMELCERILKERLDIKWTCNSRIDFVDEEMLTLMGRSGCWMISWGIESASKKILRNVRKGYSTNKVRQTLLWARNSGIKNWGYFIIGLPGETEDSIRETINFSKKLPLDIALFHVACPYPGTPFFFQVLENGWFQEGTKWENVDMDRDTVLKYPNLKTEDLLYWQRRAFREWAFRPGPVLTYIRMLLSDRRTFKKALRIGTEHLGWTLSRRRVT